MSPKDLSWATHGDEMHPKTILSTTFSSDDKNPFHQVRFDPDGYLTEIGIPVESPDTHLIGLRTTRDCFQARTLKSIQFIYASRDTSVCR